MAVTILTHFHAMSGLVFGCGVEESYVQELAIKKQLELEENIRVERDRLAQLVNKENQRKLTVRNRRSRQSGSNVKYNHMNSNETDSEDGEDFEDEDFEDDDELVDDSQHDDDIESDLRGTEQYLDGQVIMFRARSRSTSTGTVNRTLSNSSASSFEIGIDSLLKEMQVIQADDRTHQKDHIFIKSNDIDVPSITPNQLLLKNTSGSNTLTNSPSSSLVSTGPPYLSDLSNCSKTLPINHQKVNWPVSHASNSFNDAQDENNTDDHNIDVDEDSDLESDLNTHNSNLDQDNRQHSKHFKKHHHHHSRSASISSRNKIHNQNQLAASVNNGNNETSTQQVNKGSYVLKYVQDPEFGRLNFKSADQSLRLEYYTWENQGYRVAHSFYSDIAEFLDKNFRIASQMTYNTLGAHKQVDTSVFRRAVWIYIHSLFGIRYDDYDYNQIKQLLGTPLRKYIKIVCSCPERVTKKDYDNILKEITHSEKVIIFDLYFLFGLCFLSIYCLYSQGPY